MIDILIIGAGISGASMARALSRYELNVVVLERANDVSEGTTKANSGIVHAGYDPEPGTRMAKYNVEGNALIEKLCEDLKVPYQKIGSLVLGFDVDDQVHLQKLYTRGQLNGVPEMQLLTREQVMEKEPQINPEVTGALYAPTAAVVSPYELTIALMDNAVVNGVTVHLRHEVVGIEVQGDETFKVEARYGEELKTFQTRYIINAAGLYADAIHNMVEPAPFKITPNKGQYYLLDKTQGKQVKHVIFQCPTVHGKGVLVAPTAHNNLIVGPDACDVHDKDHLATSREGFDYIQKMAQRSCKAIVYRDNIRNFAGNRALTDYDDFIVGPLDTAPHFINIAGMKSPGLTSAPAIAEDVVKMLVAKGVVLIEKAHFNGKREVSRLTETAPDVWQQKIQSNPAYGKIVCRCEKITEGEIIEAIHAPVPATTVEAVKRRVRAGSGRCQGGFCAPKVVEIIARELGVPYESICLDAEGSYILAEKTGKGGKL